MDLNRIYDYMTGRPDTYKGLKGVGYEDFEKNMGDARYRRNIYNQLYINGGINSKYDAFDSSWQKTYGAGRDSSRPLEMTTGEVLPYIDLDSEKTLGEEDFSRYEAEQNPTSTMDTYDYEQMRIDPEREEKRINALRDELDSEGVTPESVYAGIEAGLADVEKNYGEALRRRNEARDSSPTPIVTGPAYFRMEGMYDNSPEARAVANYGLAKELYGKAGNMMDASFKGSGLFRGIKDTALDWDTWTSGLTKMVNDKRLDRLYKKVENGETLTADEGRLLDAATYYTLAGTLQQLSSPSVAYSIGKGFTESAPYMIEFALTYGPASSVTRGLARAVSKKLGRNVSNKIAKSGVKVLAEGTEAAATGAVQTPMSFGRIAADTRERMMGDPQVGVDKEGKPVFLGRGEGDDFWTALGKSVGAQYITNLSEVSGVIPVKAFGFLSKPAQGAIRKLTDSKYIKSIRESDFVKGARAFGKPFKIGSAPEELFEEYFEGTLNASMIGDTDLESLYSWRSLSEIAGVVLLTQATMGGLGMVENNRFKGRLVREYGRAEESFSRAVPDKDERDLIATYMNLNMNKTEGATPFDVLARQAAEAAVNRHANDFMREDGSFDTAAAEKYRADVTKAISGYFTVKPLYDAYLSGITGRKKQDEERIHEEIAGKAAGESGQIITVILQDGRRARVTGGHVVPTPDGRIDVGKTGDHFTAVYEDDGTAVQLPADESYRLEVVGVEDAVQAAVGANNEMIVREEEEAVYGPRPQIGELVYVRDSEGNPVALAVGSEVDENGNFTAVATRDYDDKVKDFPVTVNMSEIVREEQPSGGNEGVDEYQTFVDTGTVSDDVVSRIANKIAAGESLTPEEESLRQGASERVEGSLRQIKETQSVLSRIPKDEKGNPVYEQADPETAWNALLEQADGDVSVAQDVADSMVKDKEAALKKMEKVSAKGTTPADKLADAKKRKADIEKARAELEHWQRIAGVAGARVEGESEAVENTEKTENSRIKQESEQQAYRETLERGDAGNAGYLLSDEVDENGRPFVLNSNGEIVFGEIGEDTGLTPAPILLSEGYQDENGKGYGLAHIEANHGEQIRNAGFSSVEEFVSFVAQNYDEDNIRVGKRRAGGSTTYLLQVTDTHDNTLFIEMSKDGTYWNVNSAGIFRKGYSNKKETVVKTEPQQPNNAISIGSSLSENVKEGITSSEPNGEPTVSDSKDSERSGEKQGISEEKENSNEISAISSDDDIDVTVSRIMEIPNADDRAALVSGLIAAGRAEEKAALKVKNKVNARDTKSFIAEQQRIRREQEKASAEVAYWEEVQRIVNGAKEVVTSGEDKSTINSEKTKSVRDRLTALGEVINLRDYILRSLATGEYKFIWGDNKNGTKGLGSHLGFGNNKRGIEERRRRIWLLNNEEGLYPEQAAERIFENIQSEYPYLAQDDVEVFNEMLDVLRYDSAKDMVSEAEEMHRRNDTSYEAYDKDQAMYDTAMQERDEILEAENEAYRRELESQGKQVSENEEEKERYRESGDSSSAAGTSDRNDGGVDETSLQREVRKFGERMAERLGGGIRFVYARDIPESEANYKKKREAYGYYDTATGEVVVVLDNHTSKGVPSVIEVAKTVMHEVVGHKGVRGLLGEEVDAFFDDVYRGMKARSKAELESKYGGQLTRRVGESEADFELRRRRLIADEYIAQIAERGNNPGLLRRVIAKIREVLRGLGVDLAMTDNDIRNVLRRSTRELTRRKNAELNVDEEGDIRYRQGVNERFNEELERYQKGEMGNNEMFHLGNPDGVMRMFLPDLPIVMRPRIINKASHTKHNVGIESMKDLPRMISEPIFVFKRSDKALGVLTEIKDRDGLNVCVAIEMQKNIQDGGAFLEVNDIRSIHGRNAENLIKPIVDNNTLVYADKEKGLDWLSSASSNYQQEIDNQDLSTATNIVKEFENPKIGGENTRYRAAEADYDGVRSDAEREYESALDAPMDFSVAEMMPIEAARNAETTRILRDMVQRFPDTKIAITDISRIFAAADVGRTEGAESTSGLRDVAGGPSAPGGVRDDMRYRQGVNERFNDELQQQIDGTLPKGHVYGLGRPSEVLLAAGIPDLPIEMAASQLVFKSSSGKHDFDLNEVMNLPNAIANPIAVFEYGDREKAQNILTVLKHNREHFLVGMFIRPTVKGRVLEINSVRNVFPKNGLSIARWIENGKLTYSNKKELLNFLDQQRTNYADVAFVLPDEQVKQENTEALNGEVDRVSKQQYNSADVRKLFNHAANIVENFENPKVGGENVRYRIKGLRFDESNAPHYDTDIRGRDTGSFKERAGRTAERAGISLFDEQLKLKQLQNRVTEWLTGSKKGDLPDGLRFYDAENQAGSIAKDRKMRFDNEYKSRLFELRGAVYKALGNKVDDKYYYYAKTLNERIGVIGEEKMAANKATMFSHLLVEKNRGHEFPKGFTDPKIYPYEDLQDYARKEGWTDSIEGYIADCENRMGDKLVNDIWGVIGEISEYELTTSFKNGLITRDHYDILMYGQKLSEIVKGNLAAGKITEAQYNAFLSLDLTAEELHKTGFLTDEQFEGLKRRYEYYLPLKGDSEPSSEDMENYEGRHSRVSFQIKDVKGGNTRLVNDPISRLLADVYASISYQEKMSWIQSMYQALRLAERKGNGAVDFAILDNWVVKDEEGNYVPYSRNVDGNPVFTPTEGEIASGEVVKAETLPVGTEIRIPEALRGEHLVRVKHRGRTITVYFRDPGVARAVNDHFVPRKTPGWIKWSRPVTQFMSKVMTQWNVYFTYRNLFKDFGEAASNNYIQYGASYLAAYTKNYGRVMSHPHILMQATKRTLRAETPYEKMVEEFFKYGGEVSYTQMESYEKTLKDFEKELRRSADKNGVLRIGKRCFSKIGEAISDMNKIAELNARLATFITSREMGYGLRQSIRDAKEVTVNFDRRGKSSRGFGTYFLFWNAGRQSNRRKWELMRENPGRFWTSRAAMGLLNIAQTYVFGVAMSAIFGVDWEDYMAMYYDIPDYMRYNNIVILSPGGNVYRIPLSPAFSPYKTLVENVGEAVYRGVFNDKEGKYDLSKGVGDILKSLSADLGDPTNWNAGDLGQKIVSWAPAPAVPLFEAIFNVDFTGRPIYKEGNTALPGYKKAYQRTDQIYVDISEWLNEATGGEPAYGSKIGRVVNPGVMEHVIEGFLGGLIQIGTKFYNIPGSVKDGRYERLPFVDTFYFGDSEMLGEREVRNDIYEARKIVKKYNDTKSNFVKTDEDAENNPRTSRYLDRNESKIDDLKDLLKLYDEITEELKDEDSEEYRERLKMLRRDIVELTNELEEY